MGATIYTTAVQDFMKHAQEIIPSGSVQFKIQDYTITIVQLVFGAYLEAFRLEKKNMSYMIMIPICPL